ncbi:short transient receptor potential channel 6-like [Physella acuta]|uniref:short transient receptor potential channel 6-like n=1 Tax=Physella acuta TaxID=109671 RepID=UPI0027DDFF6C|nr:short transient receptor potential channel 6-like [Physella acuta]
MSRSSFGFRRSFNAGRKLSRENRKDINSQQQGQARSEHNDMHEKRQRSRHDNSDADKATRSIFGDVPLTDTERRYLWAAQSGNLPALEMLVEESGTFNLSCRDYLGRTALQLAVLGEHYDCIQLLLEKSRLDVIEEGLLHAIKTENVKICDMFLAHPVYSDQRSRMQLEFQHGFYEQEDSSSSFAPDITPIVLAAQCNNFDIVHMLIQKGFTIQTPHNYFCLCTECYNHKNFDRVVHSKSRLNAYRGLASTAYLALSCDDPIYAAFELSRSLQKLAEREKEHKSEYRGLSDKCKNFAVDLLDQCRTNEEVMSALHGGTNTRDLSRIKMAIRYEQKKFIAHASCQEHLASMWYAGASWFQHQNFPIKLVMVPLGIIFIPVTAIVYVFLPYSRIGKILKSPFMKFMNYICSYTAFLVLLFLGTQLSSFKSVHLFNGIEGVVNSLIMFYVLGMFWAECKQLWEEGVKGYFSQMWNYMDITMLALYTAGYSTEGVIYTKTNGLYMDNHLIHSKGK